MGTLYVRSSEEPAGPTYCSQENILCHSQRIKTAGVSHVSGSAVQISAGRTQSPEDRQSVPSGQQQVCELEVRTNSEQVQSSLREVDLRLDTLKGRIGQQEPVSLQVHIKMTHTVPGAFFLTKSSHLLFSIFTLM
ncbi:hypothetical protein XENOCAPTIV_010143 [Xenoophorus captivus]|uniref:Uncharacterized protein n=1 Tax=Xenoophorus captivus TaxID=1517983 RepID=A0ABV0Q956_9TELE